MNAIVMPDQLRENATHFRPTDANTRLLRDAFGRFATGVTIVTAMCEHGPIAIVANSFSSVSLDPPLVLWSPDKSSKRFVHFEKAQRYAIHVLAEDQDALCWRIAKDAYGLRKDEFTLNADGVPLLTDCLAHFECEQTSVFEAGDHAIVLGRVTLASFEEGRAGLGFFSGKIGVFQPQSGGD